MKCLLAIANHALIAVGQVSSEIFLAPLPHRFKAFPSLLSLLILLVKLVLVLVLLKLAGSILKFCAQTPTGFAVILHPHILRPEVTA